MQSARDQFEHIRDRYNAEYAYPKGEQLRIEAALSFIGTGRTVLDVGAFDGQISARIAQRGNNVTAFDGAEAALAIAGRRGLATVHGDISGTWPFEVAAFDTVFAGEIIEHLIDTDHFLQECRRVLKRPGKLVLTTPNLASLGRRLLLLFGKNPYVDTALRSDQAGHVRYFVAESLRTLLRENSFHILQSRGDFIALSKSGAGIPAKLAFLYPFAKSLIIEAEPY